MNFATPASTMALNDAEPAESDTYRLVIRNRAKQATHLSGFQMYGEPLYSGVGEAVASEVAAVAVAGVAGAIELTANEAMPYGIYTVAGATVARGIACEGMTSVKLAPGIYVAKVGSHVAKVVVK